MTRQRRFTPEQIRQIRSLAKLYNYTTLARSYGVSDVMIYYIVKRRQYKDVDPIMFNKKR